LILASSSVLADNIGIYSDATGTSCSLTTGFSTTATVIHKFTLGATGSLFSLEFPAGSTFIAFASTLPCMSTPITSPTGISLYYCGECGAGSIVLGTIIANLSPGVAYVSPAPGYQDIAVYDCQFVGHRAGGGPACVGLPCPCTSPTDQATLGRVKALYR
jgi:hypothetical protein